MQLAPKSVPGTTSQSAIQLSKYPASVKGIAVNQRVSRVYVLQGTQKGGGLSDGTPVGRYEFVYEDGSNAAMPIVYGETVRNWWCSAADKRVARGRIVWTGNNYAIERFLQRSNPPAVPGAIRLYLGVWENPHPEKKVATLDFVSTMDTEAAPFCVAITAELAAR